MAPPFARCPAHRSHWRLGATLVVLGSLAALAGCALLPPSGNRRVALPAKPVDLNRYLGRWYEMARYDVSFEHGCEAAMAAYAVRPDGLIDVVNSCHRGAVDGPLEVARARARVVPGSGNARLKVSFFGPFFIGNYWVLDHGDAYDWSIVGEGSGRYLWILTRDRHPGDAVVGALVARVAALGYDTSRLYYTKQ